MTAGLSIVILSTVTTTGLIGQAGALLVTLLYVRYVHLSPWKSRLTCGLASRWLARGGAGHPFILCGPLQANAALAAAFGGPFAHQGH